MRLQANILVLNGGINSRFRVVSLEILNLLSKVNSISTEHHILEILVLNMCNVSRGFIYVS